MKVLLTGHQGYLGTVMAPVLQQAGHDVVGLDSGIFADCVLGPRPQDPPSLDVDLRDVTAEQLRGFDAVIHLAALSNDPLGALAPEITYAINHDGASALADKAKQAGVQRFIYSSTCSVYGAAGNQGLVAEDSPLAPVTPYAKSKVLVEADLQALADDHFTTTSMRNATAFGFSPRLRADIVLNNLVGHAILSNTVLVLSDGTPWRPLVHADDIAHAFLAVLEAPRESVHARNFNVGTEDNNVTVAQIAEEVVRAVPGSELKITGEAGNDPRSYRVDFSALRKAIPGFTCRWNIRRGAEELVRAYREYHLTKEDFDNKFVRLKVLERRQHAGELDDTMRPVSA